MIGRCWVPRISSLVSIPKAHHSGEIRVCIDMCILNTVNHTEMHLYLTVDINVALNGATVLYSFDLKNGYHRLESSRKLTFSTPVWLFRYKCLVFDTCSAAEIFYDTIRQVLNNFPNMLSVSDDILVYELNKSTTLHWRLFSTDSKRYD